MESTTSTYTVVVYNSSEPVKCETMVGGCCSYDLWQPSPQAFPAFLSEKLGTEIPMKLTKDFAFSCFSTFFLILCIKARS